MRIVAGTAGRRVIEAPKGMKTRPTHEKVREAMFSMCGTFFDGGRALDLFGGSGALGLEAVSRGFDYCVFCEKGREAAQCIASNIRTLGFESQTKLMRCDFRDALKKLSADGECFDMIFVDPPYDAGFMDECLETIRDMKLLKDDGIVFAEVRSGTGYKVPVGYTEGRRREYGEAEIILLRYDNEGYNSSESEMV